MWDSKFLDKDFLRRAFTMRYHSENPEPENKFSAKCSISQKDGPRPFANAKSHPRPSMRVFTRLFYKNITSVNFDPPFSHTRNTNLQHGIHAPLNSLQQVKIWVLWLTDQIYIFLCNVLLIRQTRPTTLAWGSQPYTDGCKCLASRLYYRWMMPRCRRPRRGQIVLDQQL
jgi:hypothetical protein